MRTGQMETLQMNQTVEWQSYLYGPMRNGTIAEDDGEFCMIVDEDGYRHYVSKRFVRIKNGD